MRDAIKAFVDVFRYAVLVWFILLAGALLLWLPGQMHEYYRVAALEFAVWSRSKMAIQICLFAIIFGLIGYVCVIALNLSQQRSTLTPDTAKQQRPVAAAVAASIAVLLPFLGLVFGLIRANVDQQSGVDEKLALELIGKAYVEGVFDEYARNVGSEKYKNLLSFEISTWLYRLAAIVSVIAIALIIAINVGPIARGLRALAKQLSQRSGTAFLFFLAVFLVFSFVIFHWLSDLSETLGTFGFLTLGLGLILAVLTALACYSRQVHLPLCFAFLVWPILIAWSGLNDNDEISDWNSESGAMTEGTSDSSANYIESRIKTLIGGEPTDTKKEIPIYIVAAPGGGIYASYFASTVLTHAAEEVPKFRKHLLAISSVSGGSLGAALFASLYFNNDKSCKGYIGTDQSTQQGGRPTELSRVYFLRDFHTFDFLAPVTGALLFLDSIQAYVPWPFPELDRARALEASILEAWTKAKSNAKDLESVRKNKAVVPTNLQDTTSSPLDCPIGKVFQPTSKGPIILFNVTEVWTGRQRVLAPFTIDGSFPPAATKDVKLVTAAALSARFPYVTPPGWFRGRKEEVTKRVYLVDGGYYENSGVSTAQALIDKLYDFRRSNPEQKFKVRLIMLKGPEEKRNYTDDRLSELLSPIRALGRSRSARGDNYVLDARRNMPQCDASSAAKSSDCQLTIGLENFLYPLPLGWDMSEVSRLAIESQSGRFGECHKHENSGVVNGACFIEFLKADLR